MPYIQKKLTEPNFPMQRGQTCGLYALEGIIRALYPQTLYRATADHAKGKNWISLRHIAKNWKPKPLTVIGEIFDAKHLVTLVEHINDNPSSNSDSSAATEKLEAKVKDLIGSIVWRPVITKALNANNYIIAPFGVNDTPGPQQGQPLTGGGAHYCVIYAYAIWSGSAPKMKTTMPYTNGESWSPPGPPTLPPSYVMVRHWDANRRFCIKDLRESSKALKTFPKQYFSKYNSTGTKGDIDDYDGPVSPTSLGAKKIPAADLPKTLAGKLVIVGKKTTK